MHSSHPSCANDVQCKAFLETKIFRENERLDDDKIVNQNQKQPRFMRLIVCMNVLSSK